MGNLGIIAARAGSRGLPGKNVRSFRGRPLLAYAVEQAVRSEAFEEIAVTSDSEAYLEVADKAGATLLVMRPAELASDCAPKAPVLSHALREAEARTGRRYATVADLQPTSPLRRPRDVVGALKTLAERPELINVVSVCAARASPYYTMVELRADGTVEPAKSLPERATRRQDAPEIYVLNGAVYAWRREAVIDGLHALTERTGIWVMPDECAVDIDTEVDFEIAEFLYARYFEAD